MKSSRGEVCVCARRMYSRAKYGMVECAVGVAGAGASRAGM